MKKAIKISLIVLAALAALAIGFVIYVNAGNREINTVDAIMPELSSLSPRAVSLEGVPLLKQPDGYTCGVTTIAITVSTLTGAEVTPQSLIAKYSLGGGMKNDEFVRILSKELPGCSISYLGNQADAALVKAIHRQLSAGVPVPVFFGAENPYNKPWYDFHASVVTGLDLDNAEVTIANAYGYEEKVSMVEFLNRMSYRGGGKYPFVQRAVTRLGLMDRNAIVAIEINTPAAGAAAYTGPDYIEDGGYDVRDVNFEGGFNSDDYVPDAETACKLARIYLRNMLGEKSSMDLEPITAALDSDGNRWEIRSSNSKDTAPLISVWKKDGQVETASPSGDLVPDAETAFELMGVYVSNLVGDGWQDQKPFRIAFDADRGIWYIHGTVNRDVPEGSTGGTAGQIHYFMQRNDGMVMLIALDAD